MIDRQLIRKECGLTADAIGNGAPAQSATGIEYAHDPHRHAAENGVDLPETS